MQNIQNSQINQKVVNNHENMLQFYEYINLTMDLFTKLNKSQEYEQLIKGFNDIIPDKEIFAEEEKEKEKPKKDKDITKPEKEKNQKKIKK